MTTPHDGPQRQEAPPESLEQFIERAARTELGYVSSEWNAMQQQVQRLRSIAADLVRRCDFILTGKPYDGPNDVEPF